MGRVKGDGCSSDYIPSYRQGKVKGDGCSSNYIPSCRWGRVKGDGEGRLHVRGEDLCLQSLHHEVLQAHQPVQTPAHPGQFLQQIYRINTVVVPVCACIHALDSPNPYCLPMRVVPTLFTLGGGGGGGC